MEKEINRDLIIQIFKEVLIEKPKIAIFRIFAEKHKELAKKLDLEQRVSSGEYLQNGLGNTLELYLS